ncbi:transglycosylase domain-containing protein [Novosphingobium sp. KA1]|uniref:transglycosylase domain-containing protein n=1 Tax=Novosphingobium sp. (strain KA1) TaxID=164608 RepID=UPI001A8DE760|nr:transglycosylase domain-containing protein [Novosphingobium sp. KA1]QSR17362.1 penicillin-binding protein [Novosphingobium sp. KA1]
MDNLQTLPSAATAPEGLPDQPVSGAAPDSRAPQPKRRTRLWWITRGIAALLLAFFLLIAWLAVTAPLSKSLQPISPPQITLLAADGTPIARNGAIVDAPVEIKTLPIHVPQAFIAIEDRRFYSHWGIDPRGIARAMWSNVSGGSTQGGSTITQQLAKFTFLSAERSLTRKAREVLIAFWLEAWLTKDQILERYLSNAYFGDNCYGLRAAALHYFHRKPENLTPAQAAMLAGLMKAPSRLAPTTNYEGAAERMKLVVQSMVEANFLTPAQARAIRPPRLDVRVQNELPTGTYFADWALPQARMIDEASYAPQTYRTTLDSRLQAAARRAIENSGIGAAQVALVAMRRNGEVVAMVGGRDYAASPFNRVTQARRQPGSTFKLFVYLAALDKGWKPKDTIANTPIETGYYRPQNAGGTYSQTITLEDAFARSSNVAAVRLFQKVGDTAVIDMAHRLGVTSPMPQGDPSLALGTSTMSLMELTAAYAGVAANRFPVEPRAFPVPEAGWFDWLLDGRHSMSDGEHEDIETLLRAVVNKGTGRGARLRAANFGKTGTSQENRDALFVGYAGDFVVGVWVGNDDNTPLKGVSGGSIPARIWRDFMRQALREGGAAAPPARPRPNPSGPIEPLDVPDIGDIPDVLPTALPSGAAPDVSVGNVKVENDAATVNGQINGVPLELKLDQKGLQINGQRLGEQAPAAGSPPKGN